MKGSKLQLFNLNNISKFCWIPISIEGSTAKISFGPLNITFGVFITFHPQSQGRGRPGLNPMGPNGCPDLSLPPQAKKKNFQGQMHIHNWLRDSDPFT